MGSDSIKEVIQRITCGVYVIGVKTDTKTNGMTAAWVTQASFNPPTVLVAVGKAHYTSVLIQEAGYFSVNLLSREQYDIARKCGFASGRDTEKLQGIRYTESEAGSPLLEDCAAWMACKLTGAFEIADHVVFAGEVTSAADSGLQPMLYASKDFFG